jgi:Putative MetA-pathway of phenol degradation
MSQAPLAKSCCFGIASILFAAVLTIGGSGAFAADSCPTSVSEISTDRPDVTNSSKVVPYGSMQAENGIDWTVRQGSNVVSGTTTRLRLGVAQCTEVLADVPTYFYSLNGRTPSGFSDLVVSIKRELPVPFGFDLSATGGLGFPTGASKISGHGYDPYIQFPWSRQLTDDWSLQGMFTVTWLTSQDTGNPTFEPTLSLERALGPRRDLFVEYVGDYPNHAKPSQILDGGGSWRVTRLQQLDFHVGFALNSSSPDHFFGIGYSFRLDGLLGGSVGSSP